MFASRGSGVRVPLAPQFRSIIRTLSQQVSPEYSSKVPQPAPHEVPHRRSSGLRAWAWPGPRRGSSQVLSQNSVPLNRKNGVFPVPCQSVPASPVSVRVLPLHRWLLPRIQRASSVVQLLETPPLRVSSLRFFARAQWRRSPIPYAAGDRASVARRRADRPVLRACLGNRRNDGGRAPACSVIVRWCPNRGRGGGGLRRGWCGRGGLQGRAGSRRP